jgi:hypothetical protein
VTTEEDIASVAEQLAELTRTVEAMAKDLNAMTERADRQQARADSQQDLVDSQQERAQAQQERIDHRGTDSFWGESGANVTPVDLSWPLLTASECWPSNRKSPAKQGFSGRPIRDSNPCRRRERAVS